MNSRENEVHQVCGNQKARAQINNLKSIIYGLRRHQNLLLISCFHLHMNSVQITSFFSDNCEIY